MKKPITNLETDNPAGRVDILLYKGAEYLTKEFEKTHGLSGIWDNLKPHVHQVMVRNITGMEIPSELKVLLGILQANYQPPKIEK